MNTQIIAHRGSPYAFHENTIPAFQRAVDDGTDGIEFDVRLTKDRQWFVHHDATVLTGGVTRRIATMSAAELRETRVGPNAEPVPALVEFLIWSRGAGIPLIFDIKDQIGIRELVDVVEQTELPIPPVFSSFHRLVIKELESLRPDWSRSLIVGNPRSVVARRFLLGSLLRWSRRHQLTSLHFDEHWVTPSLVAMVQSAGMRVAVWTVDDPLRMTLLSALGVDAIITNRPEVAVRTLRKLERRV